MIEGDEVDEPIAHRAREVAMHVLSGLVTAAVSAKLANDQRRVHGGCRHRDTAQRER